MPNEMPRISAQALAEKLKAAIGDPFIKSGGELPDLNYWREVARHMGKDWLQANYHAAVFMTRINRED